MTAYALAPNGVQKSSLSNIIDEWFNNDSLNRGHFNMPSTNIIEEDDKYIIELSVPGFTKENFQINVDRNQLIVSTESSNDSSIEKGKYSLKQFSSSSFKKSFHLSDDILKDEISAKCDLGILSITLPKKDEAKTLPPRSIDID